MEQQRRDCEVKKAEQDNDDKAWKNAFELYRSCSPEERNYRLTLFSTSDSETRQLRAQGQGEKFDKYFEELVKNNGNAP